MIRRRQKQKGILLLLLCAGALLAITGCSSETRDVPLVECETAADCPTGFDCVKDGSDVKICVTATQLVGDTGLAEPPDFSDTLEGAVCGLHPDITVCGEGQVCCNTTCVAIDSDPNNCGGCGVVCGGNETCTAGECVCGSASCSADEAQICCPDGAGFSCASASNDSLNCGGCGVTCAEGDGERCLAGVCGCLKKPGTNPTDNDPTIIEQCTDGSVCCPARPEFPNELRGCVDLNTVEDCGSCGNKCGDGEQCIGGQCACGDDRPISADGLGAVCGDDQACCFNANGQQECRAEQDCRCGGTLDTTTGEVQGGVTCAGVQICCWVDLPGLPARPEPTCVDPSKDAENCGGCVIPVDGATPDNQFRCQSGELCVRNFDYSLNIPAEEQNADGIYIGECALTCSRDRVQCPGGVDQNGVPYTKDQQSCFDPLSSRQFCGALLPNADGSLGGQCSVQTPTTFGELRNFRGVQCGSGQVCRAKLQCTNPEPFPGTDATGSPCSPATHYYYDVANGSEADFPSSAPLPAGIAFDPSIDPISYEENMYLRAFCDTP